MPRTPSRRTRNTSRHHSDEDAVMSEATTSTAGTSAFSAPLTPSRSVNSSTSLGKRRRGQQGQSPERASKRIAAMKSSATTPDFPPRKVSTPVVSPTRTSIPNTFPPSKRPPNLSLNLNPIDNHTPSASSHYPSPASPAATEIACDITNDIEQPLDEHTEMLRAAGIKVRDFAYEETPNSSKAPEIFDPVPCLIAADWHMRNSTKNHGLLSAKALFRLVKMGWLDLMDIRRHFDPYAYTALAEYNLKPDERRYPFVVASENKTEPTPSQRVRLRRQAGLATYPDDRPDRDFFGYDPTGYSDDEGEGEGEGRPPPARAPTPPVPAETTSVPAVEAEAAEAEAVVVEEPKPKRRKAKGSTTKSRGRAKPKPLRRECSRPEV